VIVKLTSGEEANPDPGDLSKWATYVRVPYVALVNDFDQFAAGAAALNATVDATFAVEPRSNCTTRPASGFPPSSL
jgi:hypothetical protein